MLYMDKLNDLVARYRGEAHEDEMVGFYPLCAFGENRVAASIDTALHAFLPFPHVDHLHPDWAIALAASANGKQKLDEFNKKYGRHIAWVPWQRPGFELALMLRRRSTTTRAATGSCSAGTGCSRGARRSRSATSAASRPSIRWASSSQDHAKRAGRPLFGGASATTAPDREALVDRRSCRICAARCRRTGASIAHFDGGDDAIAFANVDVGRVALPDGHELSRSLPAHAHLAALCAVRRRRPRASPALKTRIARAARAVSRGLRRVLQGARAARFAGAARFESVGRRDPRARAVRVRQGQARGAHHVGVLRQRDSRDGRRERARRGDAPTQAEGRTAAGAACRSRRATSRASRTTSRCRDPKRSGSSTGRSRKPSCSGCRPRREFSRKIVVVVGGASGIGREVALQIARRGGHVVVADMNVASAEEAAKEAAALSSKEMVLAAALDLTSRESIAAAFRATVDRFGGIDAIVNTAAIYPTPAPGTPPEDDVGQGDARQRDEQLRARRRGGEDPEGAGAAGVDRADQLGQRRRAQVRQRAVRRQQGGDQSPDPRAGDGPRAAGARQRHRAGDRRRRVGDVPEAIA